jgi:hypothetical protein
VQGGARVEAARKRYTDSLAYRDSLKNSGHAILIIVDRIAIRASAAPPVLVIASRAADSQ